MALALAAVYESANHFAAATTPDTVSVTVAANDHLVIMGCSGSSTQVMSLPTGGGLSYTLDTTGLPAGNYSLVGEGDNSRLVEVVNFTIQ